MPYFDFPPGERMLWEFTVFRDLDWRRIAAETHGLPDRAFGSRDEAVFFAPWHFDGNPARVRIEPAVIPRGDSSPQ
jgi:hypothetical protein